MIDLLFALYGLVLIIFLVEVAGMVLVGFVKKIFKLSDETKKELGKIEIPE